MNARISVAAHQNQSIEKGKTTSPISWSTEKERAGIFRGGCTERLFTGLAATCSLAVTGGSTERERKKTLELFVRTNTKGKSTPMRIKHFYT